MKAARAFLLGLIAALLAPTLALAQSSVVIGGSNPQQQGSSNSIEPIVSASAEASHIFKTSNAVVYSLYATNLTATAGFLLLFNSTTVPADGAVTPLACAPLASSASGGVASLNYLPGPGAWFSTGVVAVVSSGASCFTKTTGVITAYLSGYLR